MNVTSLVHRIQIDLLLHGEQYQFYIKAAAVAVLFYVGYTDFRTGKIRNDVVLLLLILYVLFALIGRSWFNSVECRTRRSYVWGAAVVLC